MEEREIDLFDLIADILAHWRSVLIAMLVGAVLLGAFGYVKSYKEFQNTQNEQVTVSNTNDTTREEKIKRMKESLGDDLLAGVDSVIVWENKYDLKEIYYKNSLYMQLDPLHVVQKELVYQIQVEDNSAGSKFGIVYGNVIKNVGLYDWIEQQTRMDAAYVGELISADAQSGMGVADDEKQILLSDSNCVKIVIMQKDEESCEKLADAVKEYLAMQQENLSQEIGNHELILLSETMGTVSNTEVLDKQTSYRDEISSLKESIAKAYKKNYMVPEANVRVEINEKTGKIRLFEIRTVVDDLEDEDLEVSLDEAHDINPNYQVGDIVETEADVDHIGRLAAIQTKQLFRQKIRETEKETLYNEFADKKDDIITGIVDRVEPKFAIINIGKTGAFLGLNQQIPGETLHEGQHVKVYVSDVDRGTKGTHIVVSRTEPQFVRRLFELEVPEVYDGTVEIKSVSREPGERSKIAVYTAVEGLDPIGSCVGPKGSRVKNVVDELHGEMIDIVEWSSDPVVYISHALSPSDVLTVSVDEEKHSALVIVPDDQLSLAIGKRGQNARLAVRLTGWKIDIKSLSEATELGLMEQIQQKEELPVDETFQDEFAQEMLDKQEEKETVVEEKENTENEVEEVTSESDVEDYEDFDDYEDDEYSKYDEDIDYDEYDKYYDED